MPIRQRRNGRRRRRIRPLVGAPAPAAPAREQTTEIAQTIEARDRLAAVLPRWDAQQAAAEAEFLGALAAELSAAEPQPEALRTRWAAWQTRQAQAAEARVALPSLHALLTQRAQRFATESPAQTYAAITQVLTRLQAELNRPGAPTDALKQRIDQLQKEAAALQAPLPPAPPRPDRARTTSKRASAAKTPARGGATKRAGAAK
jgi:uncharacterized small protein (DUF1192 family)